MTNKGTSVGSHSKVPGQNANSAASDKFKKQSAEAHGTGTAPDAKKTLDTPGSAPVASDSYTSNVGVQQGANNPGTTGLKDGPPPPGGLQNEGAGANQQ